MTNVLKSLMRTFSESIWDLSERLRTDYLMLVNIMLNEASVDQELQAKIVKLALDCGLCPECGATSIHEGACVYCLCGWELCG